MTEPLVILVDKNDNQTGIIGKLEAHRRSLLHRAVSVFVVNLKGEWILQKRASDKYHSNGLWTNTCCTHPAPGQENIKSARQRLREEMGIECNLIELFTFIYKKKLENGLTEHELDHVFYGVSDKDPVINTSEVEDWEAVSFDDLHNAISKYPADYTYWFKKIYKRANLQIKSIAEKHLKANS